MYAIYAKPYHGKAYYSLYVCTDRPHLHGYTYLAVRKFDKYHQNIPVRGIISEASNINDLNDFFEAYPELLRADQIPIDELARLGSDKHGTTQTGQDLDRAS